MGRTYISVGYVTRTDATVISYRNRMAGIIKMANRDGYIADLMNINPTDVCEWLKNEKSRYCISTYRQYRAAISMWIDETSHPDNAEALRVLKSASYSPHLNRCLSTKTSALKDKKLSDKDRDTIIDWLQSYPCKYSSALTIFLRVGGEVGLRPSEWRNANVVTTNGVTDLLVKNAKSTNGRGNGDKRALQLSKLPIEMIQLIDQFSAEIANNDSDIVWNTFYNGCRKTLYRVCRRLWPNRKKYPTLYSTRHQFCANAKSAGMSKSEVAALMGHASEDTAGEHYGKRRVGQGHCAVKPSPIDVARLSDKYSKGPVGGSVLKIC